MSLKKKDEQKGILKKEVWTYATFACLFVFLPGLFLIRWISQNVEALFHTWKTPFIIAAGLLIILLFVTEFGAKFTFARDLINGRKTNFFIGMRNSFCGIWRLQVSFMKGGAFYVQIRKGIGLLWKNKKNIWLKIRSPFLILFFAEIAAYLLIIFLPEQFLKIWEAFLPFGYHTPSIVEAIRNQFAGFYLTETDLWILLYRIASSVCSLFGDYLFYVLFCFGITYLVWKFASIFRTLQTGEERITQREDNRFFRSGYTFSFLILALVISVAVFMGIFFEDIANGYRTGIVAHRAGGVLASENSLEGVDVAVDFGCIGSEIDVHRTMDGVYVINHDASFERLNGEKGNITTLTWDEMRNWLIPDTTGNGKMHRVLRIEDMLEAVKGKEKLFIELKGESADERTVDDLMKIIGERGEVEEVVLISFRKEAIEYAEEHYPNVDTGLLLRGTLGGQYNGIYDMILLEESMANFYNINQIQTAGKRVGVWTVNDPRMISIILRSNVDYMITDRPDLVEKVKKKEDERTDREKIRDTYYRFFIGGDYE